VVDEPFAKVTYRDAVKLLQEEIAKDPKKWQFPEVNNDALCSCYWHLLFYRFSFSF